MKQLTDDSLNEFTYDLSTYLADKFGIDYNNDALYDELKDLVFHNLDQYSNGYMNYN